MEIPYKEETYPVDDEYIPDYEYNNCTNPSQCSHDEFYKHDYITPLIQRAEFQHKPNTKLCCAEHGYIFNDQCEVIYFI